MDVQDRYKTSIKMMIHRLVHHLGDDEDKAMEDWWSLGADAK